MRRPVIGFTHMAKRAVRAIVLAAVLGLVIAGIFTARGDDFWPSWLVSTIYGTSIGLPAVVVFDRLRTRLGTMRELSQWVVYSGVLLGLIAFGSALTGLVLGAIGWVPLPAFWDTYRFGFAVSLIISVPTSVCSANAGTTWASSAGATSSR